MTFRANPGTSGPAEAPSALPSAVVVDSLRSGLTELHAVAATQRIVAALARTMDRAPQSAAPLSLQDKLDRISHERKVLDLLRELMRQGLHEGDELRHRTEELRGRLSVIRTTAEPEAVVILEDGTQMGFRPDDWAPP